MKKKKTLRFFSFLLSLITIFSLFSALSSVGAFAAEENTILSAEEVEQNTQTQSQIVPVDCNRPLPEKQLILANIFTT